MRYCSGLMRRGPPTGDILARLRLELDWASGLSEEQRPRGPPTGPSEEMQTWQSASSDEIHVVVFIDAIVAKICDGQGR